MSSSVEILSDNGRRSNGAVRILQLISSAGHYGAESVVLSLSRHLNRIGAVSSLGIFHNAHRPNLELAEAAARHALEFDLIPCNGRLDWGAVNFLRELIARKGIEVIHTHGYKAHAYAYLAAKSAKINASSSSESPRSALVATCHGYYSRNQNDAARLRQRMYTTAETVMLRRFDRVVAVSETLAQSLRLARVSPEKVQVITNGIEIGEFGSASPSSDLVRIKAGRVAIGLVGRLIEGKGHSDLFQAVQRMLARHSNLVVFIVGEGPLRAALEQQTRDLGIASDVLFTGKRTDMASVYAAMDICILPSLEEGMPMVILEALAARRPVIASKVGAIPQVVHEEESGLLVEPSDPAGLERALDRLMSDSYLRRAFGENGYHFVHEHCSAENMAGMYLSLYKEVLC